VSIEIKFLAGQELLEQQLDQVLQKKKEEN
jgi:hypothetical protein